MKYRCPHCRQVFEAFQDSACPVCGKHLRHPGKWKAPKSETSRRTPVQERLADSRHLRQPIWMAFVNRPRFLVWVLGSSILVVGFLMTLNINTGIPYRPPSKVFQTKRDLVVIHTALEWFRTHCKRYPTTEEGLKALIRNPGVEGWKGYYLEALYPDLWGHPFRYSSSNDTIQLSSSGPDGNSGTSDDIPAPPPDYKALMKRLAKDKR